MDELTLRTNQQSLGWEAYWPWTTTSTGFWKRYRKWSKIALVATNVSWGLG
ncbi:14888_t:CDS:2 [Rhizophagus irregularis]|nr:14888_t:CDS:2 [Rhizophagus irregularis]